MNVYDFDNTIYDGESIFDFFLFCMKKKPSLARFVPLMVTMLLKYKLCRISEAELKQKAEKYIKEFFSGFPDIDALISEFWDKNIKKIKPFYYQNRRDNDVIISASWDALISEACKRLSVREYIASEVDCESFKIKFLCYRKNKALAFSEKYQGIPIKNFYTDSMNDLPMIELSENAYLVKGNKIKRVK